MKQLTLHSAKSTKQIQTHRVRQKSAYPNKRQAGFSLIEVMVAAFVLGIGILGIVGLQVLSLKGTQQSSMRNQATAIIYGLAEKMRANIQGTIDGKYNLTKAEFDAYNCATAVTTCASNTATCDSDQLAKFDMNKVICGYGASNRTGGIKAVSAGDENILSDGLIEVGCKAGVCANGEVNMKVSWTERAMGKTETVAQHSDFIELNTRISR